MSEVSRWKRVKDDAPPIAAWVFVWWNGKIGLGMWRPHVPPGKLVPSSVVPYSHEWMVLPLGSHPVAPFESYNPRWWREAFGPPPGEEPEPAFAKGESIVRWRGSTSDLATDLGAILSKEELERLAKELVRRAGGASIESLIGNARYGKVGEPPPPVPMLLRCPYCNERHIDVGEYVTKPHATHACQICGEVWRPALVPTVGVQFLPGFKNPEPERHYLEGPGMGTSWASLPRQCPRCLRHCRTVYDHLPNCPERHF